MTDASRSRAGTSDSPPTRSAGSPANSPSRLGSRSAKSRTTDSAAETASHEREHLRRGPIKPLNVIDKADKRMLLRRVGQEAEHRQSDKKSIGLRT